MSFYLASLRALQHDNTNTIAWGVVTNPQTARALSFNGTKSVHLVLWNTTLVSLVPDAFTSSWCDFLVSCVLLVYIWIFFSVTLNALLSCLLLLRITFISFITHLRSWDLFADMHLSTLSITRCTSSFIFLMMLPVHYARLNYHWHQPLIQAVQVLGRTCKCKCYGWLITICKNAQSGW